MSDDNLQNLITSVSFFPAFNPPASGGELRYWHLSTRLAQWTPMRMFTPTHAEARPEIVKHSLHCIEHRFPKSPRHLRLHRWFERWGSFAECSAHVVSLAAQGEHTFRYAVQDSARRSRYVFHEYPYLIHLTPKRPGQRMIYDAANVEVDLQRQLLPGLLGRALVARLRRLEARACREADLIFVASEADGERLRDLYPIYPLKVAVAPNGVDTAAIRPPTGEERAAARWRLGFVGAVAGAHGGGGAEAREDGEPDSDEGPAVALFFGSRFPPNLNAARFIAETLAPANPQMIFAIAGDCGEAIRPEVVKANPNLRVLGLVDEATRVALLRACDLALNPVEEGSGVNLKMLEYLASGMPVVATPTGARGLALANGREALIVERGEMAALLGAMNWMGYSARRVGIAARKFVERGFDWNAIARRMIEAIADLEKPRIVVANTFSIWPPRSGGQMRCWQLYKRLAAHVRVEFVCPDAQVARAEARELAPGFTEVRVPKSGPQNWAEWAGKRLAGADVQDLVCLGLLGGSRLGATLRQRAALPGLWISCHPYLAHLIPRKRPFLYEALNCEADLKREILRGPAGRLFAWLAKRSEADAVARAMQVIYVSPEDRVAHKRQYSMTENDKSKEGDRKKGKFAVIHNGADTANVKPGDPAGKAAFKRALGLNGESVALFLGSAHTPNVEAARYLIRELAPELRDVLFLVAGSVAVALKREKPLANVKILGELNERNLPALLGVVDFAVNPMAQGSGSNLKMVDYMAAGLPVATTRVGARGLFDGFPDEEAGVVICSREEMAEAVRYITADKERLAVFGARARARIEEQFDWDDIGERYWDAIQEFV